MPNIASIGGVLIANIANFGGNANIANIGGVDAGDTTPPATPDVVLTDEQGTYFDVEVTTYESGGIVYWMLTESTPSPNAADIINGSHTYYVAHNQLNAPTVGIQPFTITDLYPGSGYYLWVIHQDAALNNSDVDGTYGYTIPPS